MTKIPIPSYRVRLFLSVDLSGSTAFKSTKENPIDWVPKFKDFYSGFTDVFSAQFDSYCAEHAEMCNDFRRNQPKLWKTIGDEIVYVNRVMSCAQVIAYMHSFIAAMEVYSGKLKSDDETRKMDVKGNGWLASFPYPNQTITIRDSDADLITEEIEIFADESPNDFEFLGSGIDSGFRISQNSTPSFFSVSPSLALILCMPEHNVDTVGKLGKFPLIFKGLNSLKGVINGSDYPIVGIDTERNSGKAELNRKIGALGSEAAADQNALKEYLQEFEKFHRVSAPALKLEETSKEVEEPEFYTRIFLPTWTAEYHKTLESDSSFDESSKEDEGENATPADVAKVTEQIDDDHT